MQTRFQGQYHGAALQAFIRGLGHAKSLTEQILRSHGLERIDAEEWYDLNTARSIYYTIGKQVGERSLHAVGLQMIEAAPFPPEVKDVRSVLASLDAAYHMNVRGNEIGSISCSFEDDRSAAVVFATPFPCALNRGIVQGCAKKFVPAALLEHGAGCVDDGSPSCTYFVTW